MDHVGTNRHGLAQRSIGCILLDSCTQEAEFCHKLNDAGVSKLFAPVVATSALLLYQYLAVSLFSQPVYRYFILRNR